MANSLLLWAHYALLAFAFQFASTGCRHFNFSTGLAFLIAPYIASALLSVGVGLVCASLLGLLASGVAGLAYHSISIWSYHRGSRPGQLLLISLATLAIGENCIALFWGNASIKLPLTGLEWATRSSDLEIAYLLVASGIVAFLWLLWRRSLLGSLVKALNESRLALRLRGFNVEGIERNITTLGFLVAGLAGVLWSLDLRVHPPMGFEVCLIGIVTFIVAPLLSSGPVGLSLASLFIVLVRLPIVMQLEGDWEMSPPLLVLLLALGFRYAWAGVAKTHIAHAILRTLPFRARF